MSLPKAFYVPEADGVLRATAWTRGPWSLESQHGGPPSALLARAIDAKLGESREAWIPVRTVVEILRPVPIATLRVTASLESRGRTVIRASATLLHEGRELVRARVVLASAQHTPPSGELETLPAPETLPATSFSFFLNPVGYQAAMELRMGDPWPRPAARAWSRMRVALVEGEEPSGWERALCFVDAAHGIAPGLDPTAYTIINPDLELSLARRPRGEWIGLDVRTRLFDQGTGFTRSRVVDRDGEVGAASACLVVRSRER